ncbi:hypothetical protein HOLleu_43686 [Holothuria leucospilota]|uniref:Uncharacterized protein n=1 Tax=Holothuria leucospilota TaxID=206669 RepID=A0A9Q0YDG6_HOLLE|nr:hypothetical protein HOLleu_43686 [Holothuria leucospilota]
MCSFSVTLWLFASLNLLNVSPLQGKTLYGVREFHVRGGGATFAVSRDLLKGELSRLKKQDGFCGNDLSLDLPEPIHQSRQTTEIFVDFATIEDHTLNENLTSEMKEIVAVSYRHVFVAMPFVSGDRHGLILLARFTDSTKQTFFPYSTSYERVNRIDSIDETKNGTITLRKGNDVMIINVHANNTCKRPDFKELREDVDEITGKLFTSSDYPFPFDWGCDILGQNVSFCKNLEENQCDLSRAGSDLCIEMTTSKTKRCPATTQISAMTGFFQDAVPYISAPASSIESMIVDRKHIANIIFPCFTDNSYS